MSPFWGTRLFAKNGSETRAAALASSSAVRDTGEDDDGSLLKNENTRQFRDVELKLLLGDLGEGVSVAAIGENDVAALCTPRTGIGSY